MRAGYRWPGMTSRIVWMHCGKTAVVKLELNERAIRSIFNDNISTYEAMLAQANIPTLQNRRIQDMCVLIYKALHESAPTPLSGLLTLRSNTRNLRGHLYQE